MEAILNKIGNLKEIIKEIIKVITNNTQKNNTPEYPEEEAKDAILKNIKVIIDSNSDSINELYRESFKNFFNNSQITNKNQLEEYIYKFVLDKIFSSINEDNIFQKSLFYILIGKYPQKNIQDILKESTQNTFVFNLEIEMKTINQFGSLSLNILNIVRLVNNN